MDLQEILDDAAALDDAAVNLKTHKGTWSFIVADESFNFSNTCVQEVCMFVKNNWGIEVDKVYLITVGDYDVKPIEPQSHKGEEKTILKVYHSRELKKNIAVLTMYGYLERK